MARTAITVTDVGNQGSVNPLSTATDNGDSTNNMKFLNDGSIVLYINNDTGASASVTVISVSDEAGRTGDISLTVANGDRVLAGPFRQSWWNQSSTNPGEVHVDMDANVNIAALRLTT